MDDDAVSKLLYQAAREATGLGEQLSGNEAAHWQLVAARLRYAALYKRDVSDCLISLARKIEARWPLTRGGPVQTTLVK